MTLKQLIRRNGEAKYRISKNPTNNKKRYGIQILDAEGNPNVDITIFTVGGMSKDEIKPTSNVIKTEAEGSKEVVWILTNKKGIEWGDDLGFD